MSKWAELMKDVVELEDGCEHAIYNINMELICHHPFEEEGVKCETSSKCYKVQSFERLQTSDESGDKK